MDFSHPKPRRQTEPALPMINVVFLLLIFFLMSAQIVASPPFEVTPPSARQGSTPHEELRLHISSAGMLALGEATETDAWRALAALPENERPTILIRADASLPAASLASVLTRLGNLGFEKIQIATVPK